MFHSVRKDMMVHDKGRLLKDSLVGLVLGALFALINMFGYTAIMELGAERYLDRFTLEAKELYVNYPLVLVLMGVTLLAVHLFRRWYNPSSFFYIMFILSFVVVGWYYVAAITLVALYRIKYLID
ncbi:MAG: hypothetical protein JW825_05910 [Candidatus Methanofastidiosa archaeon]|nr:hypothetical protein [Candidatus Methanofastidiosa archaeon]